MFLPFEYCVWGGGGGGGGCSLAGELALVAFATPLFEAAIEVCSVHQECMDKLIIATPFLDSTLE